MKGFFEGEYKHNVYELFHMSVSDFIASNLIVSLSGRGVISGVQRALPGGARFAAPQNLALLTKSLR